MIQHPFGQPVSVPDLPAGVIVRRGAWIPALAGRIMRLPAPASAVTLGSTIIVHPAAVLSARLLRHELAHVRQWRHNPLLFPLAYIWHHFRHGYRNNPYEIEARQAEPGPERRPS